MPIPESKEKYTYADYLTWPEEERWEIIDGVPYMQAAPSTVHQEILMEISRQIANHLKDKSCKVYPAPFCVRLTKGDEISNEDIKKVVEPDITIVCDKSKVDEKGCNGAPDMIVEIISPSSIKTDRIIKFNMYEKVGVKEYWIVEPEVKIVSVFVLQENGRYGRQEVYSEEDQITLNIIPDLTINLKLVFTGI
ncbi:Uma2 family endonuclease [Desulfosporosinus sp. SB140]|uniref:Uma2 family endonuclease n=1 Tax=Desulfosporosinus paludis TaxID=3115649 RepID=UPI00388F4DA7